MRVLSDHDRRDAAARPRWRTSAIEIGPVVGCANSVRGSGVVLFARLAAESVRGAGGAALHGARPNSDWQAVGHRRKLPGRGLAGRVAIFSRSRVGLLAAPRILASFLHTTRERAFRPRCELAGHRDV